MTLQVAAIAMVGAGLWIGVFGTRLARVVDRLADRTGIGEALAGALLMGGATSLAGLVVSVVAALDGNASLAVSNSVGGIAAQTAFIVVADLFYRRGNLEHAAASLGNIFNSLVLLILLAIVVIGASVPGATLFAVSPVTPVLVFGYVYGMVLARRVEDEPMWKPRMTSETRTDEPDPDAEQEGLTRLWTEFALLAVAVVVAGFVVARAGLSIVASTGVSGTLVGAFATSIMTSLPELVTTVAAVRTGALTLAVGGIVGGNAFDLLFIAASDVAYRDGSVYAALTQTDDFTLGWAMLMVGILATGLVRRQEKGIGFEGVGVLAVYFAGLAVVTQLPG